MRKSSFYPYIQVIPKKLTVRSAAVRDIHEMSTPQTFVDGNIAVAISVTKGHHIINEKEILVRASENHYWLFNLDQRL